MKVVVIDYGSGNLHSTLKSFEKVASTVGATVVLSDNPAELADATHIVLPGVGAFKDCMQGLEAIDGMHAALDEQVLKNKKPFLGICVGMQLLAKVGKEHGEYKGLGWIDAEVVALAPEDKTLKIPHMGWNTLVLDDAAHPIVQGLDENSHAYFVHSYHMQCAEDVLVAHANYGQQVTAIVAKDNIVGTQFHPEKSMETGMQLIENFLKM